MENKKIQFARNVMLIDASYLDKVGSDVAAHFAPVVHRELPKADLAVLLECMALDAGIPIGENEIQVCFLYDSESEKMKFCTPSVLEKELHDVAFKSQLGEFSLFAFSTTDLITREDLFGQSLVLAAESKEVRHLVLVPDEDAYGEAVGHLVEKIKDKESVTVLGMNPPSYQGEFSFEMLGFPILQSLGIRAEEL